MTVETNTFILNHKGTVHTIEVIPSKIQNSLVTVFLMGIVVKHRLSPKLFFKLGGIKKYEIDIRLTRESISSF